MGASPKGLGRWLPPALPQVVLLHVGTNDIQVQPSGISARLGALIDHIVAAAPAAAIFVAQIVPTLDAGREQLTIAYNAAIPGIVSARAAASKRVYLVNMHDALTASAADFEESVHPNASGHAKMATVWYNALLAKTGILTE